METCYTNSSNIGVMAFGDVTPCNLVDTNVTEELAV
jgi:hypothetical protein